MIDDASQKTMDRIEERDLTARVPPHLYFFISAIFHYLGPSFAVLLFGSVPVLGVAWLRIATASVVFAIWRRPWRVVGRWSCAQRRLLIALGSVLAVMNVTFYLAIDRLPLGTVGAIEFLGTVVLAAYGVRSRRNGGALVLAFLLATLPAWATVVGVVVLRQIPSGMEALGVALIVVAVAAHEEPDSSG